MNIIYLRVSKENKTLQDPKQQLKAILDKFKLKNYEVYEERGSAYDLSKLGKRTEFYKVLQICFDIENTTIKHILDNITELGNKEQINIYVWDWSRLVRNMALGLQITLLAEFYKVNIYSHNDTSVLPRTENESTTQSFIRFLLNQAIAYGAQIYSDKISEGTLKSIVNKKDHITHSTYGIAFGTFKANDNWQDYWSEVVENNQGKRLSRVNDKGYLTMTYEEKDNIIKHIKWKLRHEYKFKARRLLVEELKNKKGIIVSEATLSHLSKAL